MDITREYVTAIRLKHANAIEKGVRQMELSAYFTHCNLQPAHLALALNFALAPVLAFAQLLLLTLLLLLLNYRSCYCS